MEMWRGKTSSAVQCSTERRGAKRKGAQRRAHKQSCDLDLRLHAHFCLQDEDRENRRERKRQRGGRKDEIIRSSTTAEPGEIEIMRIGCS